MDCTPAESQNDPGLTGGNANILTRRMRPHVTGQPPTRLPDLCPGHQTSSLLTDLKALAFSKDFHDQNLSITTKESNT